MKTPGPKLNPLANLPLVRMDDYDVIYYAAGSLVVIAVPAHYYHDDTIQRYADYCSSAKEAAERACAKHIERLEWEVEVAGEKYLQAMYDEKHVESKLHKFKEARLILAVTRTDENLVNHVEYK